MKQRYEQLKKKHFYSVPEVSHDDDVLPALRTIYNNNECQVYPDIIMMFPELKELDLYLHNSLMHKVTDITSIHALLYDCDDTQSVMKEVSASFIIAYNNKHYDVCNDVLISLFDRPLVLIDLIRRVLRDSNGRCYLNKENVPVFGDIVIAYGELLKASVKFERTSL